MRRRSGFDSEIFGLLEDAGRNCVRAAELLEHALEVWPDHGDGLKKVVECEQRGDEITYAIVQRLAAAPDRDAIIALASGIDDVVDYIEEVAAFLELYRIEAPMEQAQRMASVVNGCARTLAATIDELRSQGDIARHIAQVNRLENEGDELLRAALGSLFEHDVDPMFVIRWKDIFERLEESIDAAERAVNQVESNIIRLRSS